MRSLTMAGAAVVLIVSAARAEDPDSFEFEDLALPPVDITGAVTYTLEMTKIAGESERSWTNTATTTLSPSTYIYEPWLATVRGSLYISESMSTAGLSTYLTGSMAVAILPRSEYPVELSYQRYSSIYPDDSNSIDLTGQIFRLRNRAALPWDVSSSSELSYTENSDAEGAHETYTEASFMFGRTFEVDDITLSVNIQQQTLLGADGNYEEGSAQRAVLLWRSKWFDEIATESSTTIRHANYRDDTYDEDSFTMQGVSSAFWRPSWDPDLTLYGATRTYSASTLVKLLDAGTTEESNSNTAYGSVGATYTFSPHLVATGGFNLGVDYTTLTSGGEASESLSVTTGLNASIYYSSEPTDLLGFDYSYSAGTTSQAEYGSDETRLYQNLALGHSARTTFDLPWIGSVYLGLNQNIGAGYDSTVGPGYSISHTVNLGRSERDGKHWSYFQVSGADSRTFGTSPSESQLINIMYSRGYDADRFTSISGSIGLQVYRQVTDGETDGWIDDLTGDISYRESNVFGIDNLSFTSTLYFNPPSLLESKQYDYSGYALYDYEEQSWGTQRWTNRIEYRIGKLRASLLGIVENDDEGMSESILFQVSRSFY